MMQRMGTRRQSLRKLNLPLLLAVLAGCSNGGNVSPFATRPAGAAGASIAKPFAHPSIQQQIADGSVVPACPTSTFGGVRCQMLILRRTELAPRSVGVDGHKLLGYGPSQLQSAYNIASAAKNYSGGLVALVEGAGYPALESDLAVYRKEFGLPRCTKKNGCLQIVNEQGQSKPLPGANTEWEEEQALDVDMVSANCPNCRILVVQASTSLYVAENTAAGFGPVAISNSWDNDEVKTENTIEQQYFNHPGIAITVASGDWGYGVYFPAAANTVTAVGGTALISAKNARGYDETVWVGSSSGCSQYEPVPSWQASIENALGGCSNRIVSDVAYNADPATGVAIYDSMPGGLGPPGWQVVGGTSEGAPAIAAIYALSGNTVGVPASMAYANPGDLYDVTSGSDGACSPPYLCSGESGYDGPTGLGSPNGLGAF